MNYKILLRKGLLVFLSIVLTASFASAQKTITGTVTDESGGGLPGVSVLEKGTTNGTMTDMNGHYLLEASDDATMLVFSFIGMETQGVAIRGNIVDCLLIEEDTEIDEVIVVGYGTMKKSDKTGAVTNVTADELNGGVLTDPIQGLVGKAAGVMITKQGGDPNAGFSVKIRGSAAFGSGTEPLYVIDGVPGVDPTTVAPEDIESFNILKDASSTAIYGARGANGVVIITTKKGKKGNGSKVSFNSYYSIDKVAKRYDLLSATDVRDYVSKYSIDFSDGGADTDWQNEIFRTGTSQSYNIAISGGGDKTSYYTSYTHTDFSGVILGSEKVRDIARVNLTQKALNNKLTISANVSGTLEKNKYVSYGGWGTHDVLYQAFRRSPTDPLLLDNGDFHESDRLFNSKNPVATLDEISNTRDAKRFLGNVKADLEIIDGLVFGTNLSYIRDDSENSYFLPTYSYKAGEGWGNRSYGNYSSQLLETTLKYSKTFASVHNINLLAGYSFQEDNSDGFSAGGSKPASNYVQANNLGLLQNVKTGNISSYRNSARMASFFGRAAYNLKSKYFLTATVRADGSSKFGDNNEWGVFPALNGAWNMKEEGFLKGVSFISMLKLRAGYGITGNQDIGLYLDKTIMKPAGTAIDPETGETVISFEGDKNPNPDLQWEENKEYGFGIDYGFWGSRISGSIDYYDKATDHLVAQYSVGPPTYKYASIWANEGFIRNKGLEFNTQVVAVDKKNFDWNTSFTFSTNKQEVISLDGGKYNIELLKQGYVSGPGAVGGENWTQVVMQGHELGSFYMPEYAGLSADGKFLFHTAEGGVTRNFEDAERRFVGSALPDYELAWSNNFTFLESIDLSFAFRAILGYDVYNGTKMFFGNPNGLMPNGNVLRTALDEKEAGLTSSPTLSSYYLEDASFLRLDNISIGYNFNAKKIRGVEKLRVYFTSNNLWLLTGYSGLDPEINFNGLSFGVDTFSMYPKTKTFTFGLNLTF